MTAPIRRRTRAREVAMQALFQFDVRGRHYCGDGGERADGDVEAVCRAEITRVEDGDEDSAEQRDSTARKLNATEREILQFANKLVSGTLEHRDEIDAKLQAVTRNWDLRRMAIVDRNVLRMAVYELMWCDDVPQKVAINEAIEIGKKFSTANSGGFVNGILDRIRIDLARSKSDGAADAATS
ncbi:MAG: transcription antitermination factor NusB [Planctomycetes bacterium]|nr:transcription antitermination factor NusB [Planctomycetota bacterium]